MAPPKVARLPPPFGTPFVQFAELLQAAVPVALHVLSAARQTAAVANDAATATRRDVERPLTRRGRRAVRENLVCMSNAPPLPEPTDARQHKRCAGKTN